MAIVSGTYLTPNGLPATGCIHFKLLPPAVDGEGSQRTSKTVTGTLDAAGFFSVDLVPDSDLIVDGDAVYQVAERIDSLARDWMVHLIDDSPVDLPSRYPGSTLSPGAVIPVPGADGADGADGTDGAALIDDEVTSPDTSWSSEQIERAISAALAPAPTVRMLVTGQIEPWVTLQSGSTASISWEDASGVVLATGPTPTIDQPVDNIVAMKVVDATGHNALDEVEVFNLGFDNSQDAGDYRIPISENWAPQPVTGISGVNNMTNLVWFMAADDHTGVDDLTGFLDLSGMSSLEFVECYFSNVTSVDLTGCDSIVRLCFERSSLESLDLDPVASTIRDLRGRGQNNLPTFDITLTQTAPLLYHYCVGNENVGHFPHGDLIPVVTQYWGWDGNVTGHFTLPSSGISNTDVRMNGNSFDTIDLNGAFSIDHGGAGNLILTDSNLSAIDFSAAVDLGTIDLEGNNFDGPGMDIALVSLDVSGAASGGATFIADASSALSSAGLNAITSLEGKGWTVTIDAPVAPEENGPVTNLIASGVTDTSVTLSWDNPTYFGTLTGITVRRAEGATPPATTSDGVDVPVTGTPTTITDTGLVTGTEYSWSVFAVHTGAITSDATSITRTTDVVGGAAIWSDDFNRADATGGAAVGDWSSSGTGHDVNIVSSHLETVHDAGYGVFWTPTDVSLPADYEVAWTVPLVATEDGADFRWLLVRFDGTTGVRFGFGGDATDLSCGAATSPSDGEVSVWLDNPLPADWWLTTRTLKLRLEGALIEFYMDDVLIGHASHTVNESLVGGSIGWAGEGGNRLYDDVTVTEVVPMETDAVWSDDFERADATGVVNVGNGWIIDDPGGDRDLNIVSGALVQTGSGFGRTLQPATGILPADFALEYTSGGAWSGGNFVWLIGRWDGTDGVKIGFRLDGSEVECGNASAPTDGNVTVTEVNATPADWWLGVHTLRAEFEGSLISLYMDGTLLATATNNINTALVGGQVGIIGESFNRTFESFEVSELPA